MATRSRTSFQKRQKELLRMEKQREKAARRMQRKLAKESGAPADAEPGDEEQPESEDQPPDPEEAQ